jgi:hypothetical protein
MKSIVRDIYPPNGTAELTCSVNNDDHARWLAQRIHRSFGNSVDVNARFHGWLLLVIGARPVELSIIVVILIVLKVLGLF